MLTPQVRKGIKRHHVSDGGCVVPAEDNQAITGASGSTVLAACLVVLFAGPADAAGLKPRAPGSHAPVRLCVIPPLALAPIYVTPEPVAADDEDEDDEEDEDEDEDEETVRGMLDPASGTCIALSGALTGSMQGAWMGLPARIGSRGLDITTFSVTSTMKLTTLSKLADGTEMRTSFGMLAQPVTDSEPQGLQVVEAFVGIGGWNAGYGASTFNFWGGDEFLFGARIPARSAQQVSHTWQITEGWAVSLAMENGRGDTTAQRPATLQPLPGLRWPDAVAKASYWSDTLQVHLAGAITERAGADGKASRVGVAAIAGTTYALDLFGRPQRLTAQVAGAVDAPLYLGTQVDVRVVRSFVDVGDATRGFSAVVSSSRDWTDQLTTNVYASMLRLDFPELGARSGRAEMWRGAANIVFSPVKGMRFGLEGGLSRARIDLPNRIITNDPSGRQKTAVLWFSRGF